MAKESVKFRLDEDELAEIDAEAEAEGISRSAYIRRILKRRGENGRDDLDGLRERIGELEERINSGDSTRPRARETDAVRDAVGAVDLPSTKDADACEDAVRAAVEFLEERGSATMREFVIEVMPDHPVGYDAEKDAARIRDPDERNRSTWWRKVIKPGLENLDSVERPAPGASEWTYSGD